MSVKVSIDLPEHAFSALRMRPDNFVNVYIYLKKYLAPIPANDFCHIQRSLYRKYPGRCFNA